MNIRLRKMKLWSQHAGGQLSAPFPPQQCEAVPPYSDLGFVMQPNRVRMSPRGNEVTRTSFASPSAPFP